MTSTAETPGPYDALEKARPGEPLFPLMGRDPHAPATILHWVDLRRKDALELTDPEDRRAELLKLTDAEMVACDMRRYRKDEPAHDTTARQRASYNGTVHDADHMDEVARKAAIANHLAQLREAAYFLSEGREGLSGFGELEPQQIIDLSVALQVINQVADAHTPTRLGVQVALPLGEVAGG